MSNERSLTDLTADLGSQIGELLRNEVRLGAAEALQVAERWKSGGILIATGAIVAIAALTVLLVALAFGLSAYLSLWMSLLVMALVGGLVAYLLVQSGVSAIKQHHALPHTSRQVKRDTDLIKETLS